MDRDHPCAMPVTTAQWCEGVAVDGHGVPDRVRRRAVVRALGAAVGVFDQGAVAVIALRPAVGAPGVGDSFHALFVPPPPDSSAYPGGACRQSAAASRDFFAAVTLAISAVIRSAGSSSFSTGFTVTSRPAIFASSTSCNAS